MENLLSGHSPHISHSSQHSLLGPHSGVSALTLTWGEQLLVRLEEHGHCRKGRGEGGPQGGATGAGRGTQGPRSPMAQAAAPMPVRSIRVPTAKAASLGPEQQGVFWPPATDTMLGHSRAGLDSSLPPGHWASWALLPGLRGCRGKELLVPGSCRGALRCGQQVS